MGRSYLAYNSRLKALQLGSEILGAAPPLILLPIFLCCVLLGISLLTQSREEGGWDSRGRMGFVFSSVSLHWAKVHCISAV